MAEGKEGESPLELEHVIGYSGQYARTFLSHPKKRDGYLKSMGSIVVVGDLNDPHQQELLRGHDEAISALAVSKDGSLAASGQAGTTRVPGHAATVVVWRLQDCTAALKLRTITLGVTLLAFSDDTRFLMAAGKDGVLVIWDAETGEVAFGKKYAKKVAFFEWVATEDKNRRRSYWVAMAITDALEVEAGELAFDQSRQQWSLETRRVAMPSSGLVREYRCTAVAPAPSDHNTRLLLVGSTQGDLVVFRVAGGGVNNPKARGREVEKDRQFAAGGVFRASLPVCSGGLLALAVVPTANSSRDEKKSVVFAGAGDGTVLRLEGNDAEWRVVAKTAVDGAACAVSVSADGAELLVGTDTGRTYRILAEDVGRGASLVSVSHVARPSAVAFGTRPGVCCTVAEDGEAVIWDLGDFGALASTKQNFEVRRPSKGPSVDILRAPKRTKFGEGATCVAWVCDVAVAVGFGDATIRCFNAGDGKLDWEIPTAHRTKISAIACHVEPDLTYLVSGAQDGTVRVWNLATRDLTIEFNEHRNSVVRILVDKFDPYLFHTAGKDCAVFTYDLRTEKRTVAHLQRNGAFTGLGQRSDSERELATTDANGAVLFWDCDFPDPVGGVNLDPSLKIRALAISPTGAFLALGRDETLEIFALPRNDVSSPPIGPVTRGWAHSDHIQDIQWAPDERQLVSVADDACVCIWNFFGTVSSLKEPSDHRR